MSDYNINEQRPLYFLCNPHIGISVPLFLGINEISSNHLINETKKIINQIPSFVLFKISIHSHQRATIRTYEEFPLKIISSQESLFLMKSSVKALILDDRIEFIMLSPAYKFAHFILRNNICDSKFTEDNNEIKQPVIQLPGVESSIEDKPENETSALVQVSSSTISISKKLFDLVNMDQVILFLHNNNFFNTSGQPQTDTSHASLHKKKKREMLSQENIEAEKQTCLICLDPIKCIAKISQCGHSFCKTCLESWTVKASTCPLCKKNFRKISVWNENKKKFEFKKISAKQFKYHEEEEENELWVEQCRDCCIKCQKSNDVFLMLVCDKCHYNVCHTYCDGLDKIPDGEWYCSECRKIRNLNSKKPRRKLLKSHY